MEASVEAVDGDIVLKLKNLPVEEGKKKISVSGPQNFIHSFYDTIGEGHGSNRGKSVIDHRIGAGASRNWE